MEIYFELVNNEDCTPFDDSVVIRYSIVKFMHFLRISHFPLVESRTTFLYDSKGQRISNVPTNSPTYFS